MRGCCVQVHGLPSQAYNGRRGTVSMHIAEGERLTVKLDGTDDVVNVKKENLCHVFCIGLPREYRIKVQHDAIDENALARAICAVDSSKFYILFLGTTTEAGITLQHFMRVRLEFFYRAMSVIASQNREPLMRCYIGDFSQADANAGILFGDCMPRPAETPAFADLASDLAEVLSMAKLAAPFDLARNNLDLEMQRVQRLPLTPTAAASQNKCGTKRKQ